MVMIRPRAGDFVYDADERAVDDLCGMAAIDRAELAMWVASHDTTMKPPRN